MDIKRVAFETKPISGQSSVVSGQSQRETTDNGQRATDKRRGEIAALVDKFLRDKISETPERVESREPRVEREDQRPKTDSPVKTIIHELKPQSSTNGAKPKAVDFVSEDDVRKAVENGEKIYITAKTIITPSARDLGEEREIFAKV